MAKYFFSIMRKDGKTKVFQANSSRQLKEVRSVETKIEPDKIIDVTRILKSDSPLSVGMATRIKKSGIVWPQE
jgi:hypothetical protein